MTDDLLKYLDPKVLAKSAPWAASRSNAAAVTAVGALLALAFLVLPPGCAPGEKGNVQNGTDAGPQATSSVRKSWLGGVEEQGVIPGTLPEGAASRPTEPDPRLVEILQAIAAGEPTAIGNKVMVLAQQAELSAGAVNMRQVTFELPDGSRTPEFPVITLMVSGDELGAILAPTPGTRWSDVVAVFNALTMARVTEIGFAPSSD